MSVMCVVPSCGRPVSSRGWCNGHYEAWRRTGVAPTDRFADTVELRLMAQVIELPNGCWWWTGTAGGSGTCRYGRMRVDGVQQPATRVSYELFIGPYDHSLDLDHLCRLTLCVNPFHLEPVTHRENILRSSGVTAVNAAATRCKRGHRFTPENTRRTPQGWRACVACDELRCRHQPCRRMPESCTCSDNPWRADSLRESEVAA